MGAELFPAGQSDVLYLVDLSSYVLRAYHAIQPLSNTSGEPTHAVLGTVNMLERLLKDQRPSLFAIAMDSGRATFRRELYPEYKANRPKAPDDLRRQLERCEQVVRALAMPILKKDGVEADDLIACAVQRARSWGLKVVIVAADKDLMQLVGDDVLMWDTMRNRVFGKLEVEERFGVRIDQLRDLFALMGDSSDNIPGVPSIGPKTASELLREHESLAGIYQAIDSIKKKKLKETLLEHRQLAFLSQSLVTLKEDCDVAFELEELRLGARDVERLRTLYEELGFQRQLSLLETEPSLGPVSENRPIVPPPAVTLAPKAEAVVTPDALKALAQRARTAGTLALAAFANDRSAQPQAVVGLCLSLDEGHAHYVPLGHRYVGVEPQLDWAVVREVLGTVLADPGVLKVGHDLKRTRVLLGLERLSLAGLAFDVQLASYLLDPEAQHGLEALATRELGLSLTGYDEVTRKQRGKQLAFDEVPIDEATRFAGGATGSLLALRSRLLPRLREAGLEELFEQVEMPLAAQLADLESAGVLVDADRLKELGRGITRDLVRLEAEAQRVAGQAFNVHSPRQLEVLLFDKLGLKPLKRTKTSRSTDATTLETLADEHELPRLILEIRQLAKLKGTYIDALPSLINPRTRRLHTTWEQAVAATGRLSSSDPNLQNIPIRSALGRSIRTAFVAPPGRELVSADYSQIELRILAHLSRDEKLVDAFRSAEDVHTRTAMEVFEVSPGEVTREMRTRAKAVNFGVIYGQGDSGLAKSLGISRAEAAQFIAAYFRRYEGVRRFMNDTLESARQSEAVRSAFGRRRLLPDIRSGNRARRLAAERIAMNMPIQGTAADVLKKAMLAFREPVTEGTRMILTVHDELVFEVPSGEVERAVPLIKQRMENVVSLAVPLVVDIGHGPNWSDAHR